MRHPLRASLLLGVALAAMAPAAQEQRASALREQVLQALRDAAAAAATVESDLERGKILAEIGAAQRMAGDRATAESNFQRAQALLDTAIAASDKPELVSFYQGAVANARAKAGDLDGAAEALANVHNPNARVLALDNLIAAQLKAGKADDAAQTALALEDGNSRDRFLATLVSLRARSGDLEDASKLLDVISRPEYKAPAMAAIAARYASDGKREQADARMREALVLARSVQPGGDARTSWNSWPGCQGDKPDLPGDLMMEKIAESQAQMRDFSGAMETLHRIESSTRRENLLAALASLQAAAGDFKGAHANAALIERKSCRATAREFIVTFELMARDLSGAAATIEAIEDPLARARALTKLAEAQVNTGDSAVALVTLQHARDLATAQTDDDYKAFSLARVALWQARAGNLEAARKTFDEAVAVARGLGERGLAGRLHAIAQRQAEAGFVEEAIGVADAAPPPARPMIVRLLMQAAGRGERSAEANTWAQGLTSPLQRAYALLGLAEGMLERVSRDKPSGDTAVSIQKQ